MLKTDSAQGRVTFALLSIWHLLPSGGSFSHFSRRIWPTRIFGPFPSVSARKSSLGWGTNFWARWLAETPADWPIAARSGWPWWDRERSFPTASRTNYPIESRDRLNRSRCKPKLLSYKDLNLFKLKTDHFCGYGKNPGFRIQYQSLFGMLVLFHKFSSDWCLSGNFRLAFWKLFQKKTFEKIGQSNYQVIITIICNL